MSNCVLRSGERALVTLHGVLFPDGTLVPSNTVCDYQPGSTLYFQIEDGAEIPFVGPPPVTPEKDMEPTPIEQPFAEDAPVVEATPPAEGAHPPIPDFMQKPSEAKHPVSASTEADSDLGVVLGAGEVLKDNPWAPLVMLVLAAVGVLGGKKAWSVYSERGAQQHELALKRLEIEEKQAKHQQPPACLLRDAEHDTKFAALDARITALETKVSGMEKSFDLGDFDPEDLKKFDRRIKKLEKSVKELDSEDKE